MYETRPCHTNITGQYGCCASEGMGIICYAYTLKLMDVAVVSMALSRTKAKVEGVSRFIQIQHVI